MSYILIILMVYNGYAATSQAVRFTTKEACETTAKEISVWPGIKLAKCLEQK